MTDFHCSIFLESMERSCFVSLYFQIENMASMFKTRKAKAFMLACNTVSKLRQCV